MEGKKMVSLFLVTVSWSVFMPTVMANTRVPAIFVFGDSTVDVGNNNYLPGPNFSIFKANYPHNGIDLPHGIPTGRFSNGYNAVDSLARMMGFRESPPAVLSLTTQSEVLQGVNFASGGSGILDTTGQNFSLSMNTQIMHFKKMIENRLMPQMGNSAATSFISDSLFFFSTGNNDIYGFYAMSGPQNSTQHRQFSSLLSAQFKDQLKRLYELGARKFVVIGMSHIGCIPFQRNNNPLGRCIKELNIMARQFNKATKVHLRDLSSKMDGMNYSFSDVYKMLSKVKAHPIRYGFKDVKNACCGAGRFKAASGCTSNATYCSNRDEYFSWDRFHPTEAGSKLMIKWAYYGSRRLATPINIKKLALI